MSSKLPPYLTSGASSRAHHALLVKLHEAGSDQEERDILAKEVLRLKEGLAVRGQSTSKVADSLILLLHVGMIRQDTSDDLSFGLIHAVHLAESCRTIREKRIGLLKDRLGYLYLQERLEDGNELGLMLINTIRKDLMSSSVSNILLALHTIVKMPTRDLAPAVTPLLTSKTILKHKLPSVRQRAIQALAALHITPGATEFPLSMSKIVKILSEEEDDSVLLAVTRTLRSLLEYGTRQIDSEEEARFLADIMIDMTTRRVGTYGQLELETVRTLCMIMQSAHGASCEQQILDFMDTALPNLQIDEGAGAAMLLEMCRLVIGLPDPTAPSCVSLVRVVVSGLASSRPSSSREAFIPEPNVHVLVLRCLSILPLEVWEGQLEEVEMAVIMDGLHSPDDTIRRSTLRLLHRLSPDLLGVTFDNLLSALRNSSDLALPLNSPTSLAAKTITGRLETSSRALEVAEILRCGNRDAETAERGSHFGQAVVEIVRALNEGVVSSTSVPRSEDPDTASKGGQVWEEGLRRVVSILSDQSDDFKSSFTKEILRHRLGSATLAVLRCTTVCEVILDVPSTEVAVKILLDDLRDFGPSVQEVVLVALVVLGSEADSDHASTIQAIREVQMEVGKHIKKRCGQVVDLIQQKLVTQVMNEAKSRSIPDILHTMIEVHSHWRQIQRGQDDPSVTSPRSPPRSNIGDRSSLRYTAYDPPSKSMASSTLRQSTRYRDSPEPRHRIRASAQGLTAGDLALFDADEGSQDDGQAPGRLASISIPDSAEDGHDPFARDEARTPTLRESRQVASTRVP